MSSFRSTVRARRPYLHRHSFRPRNLTKISFWLLNCQPCDFTRFPHLRLTSAAKAASLRLPIGTTEVVPFPPLPAAQQNASSFPLQRRIPNLGQKLTISARAESEDDRLRKDRLEVLAKIAGQECPTHTHKPFGKLCPRIQDPVAEANSSGFLHLLVYYV